MNPKLRYVDALPDLVTTSEAASGDRIFKFQVSVTNGEITILGDSAYSRELSKILEALGKGELEVVLCG